MTKPRQYDLQRWDPSLLYRKYHKDLIVDWIHTNYVCDLISPQNIYRSVKSSVLIDTNYLLSID
ncbi:unnamed protein product [Schistosoma mattheei]|uniref:Uncharacterized protein n=1 Tax=Schistosoma mattheei TaxID=31246 RepID=A0A183PYL6_9TREM|nr:unnamed protein product [Schistosoma mattheei]